MPVIREGKYFVPYSNIDGTQINSGYLKADSALDAVQVDFISKTRVCIMCTERKEYFVKHPVFDNVQVCEGCSETF